ncbi:MAG: ATP-binding protein [Chthoniobacterales bacterium]
MTSIESQSGMLNIESRATEVFDEQLQELRRGANKLFFYLLPAQWIACVLGAIYISPLTWIGRTSFVHIHVWASIFIGALITLFPMLIIHLMPYRTVTRHVVAIAQVLMSALLIHVTGGRIETHFHIFGSLAILAFYRDWKVLLSATIVVALDHFLRGVFWPQSVFGVFITSYWRWLEHAGWVIFEDIFLVILTNHSLTVMKNGAIRQAQVENTNLIVEEKVALRTKELNLALEVQKEQRRVLETEIAERERIEGELLKAHQDLLNTSRVVGMAEIATNVLHNVGNVLNSVNVSANLVSESIKQSKAGNLVKAVALLREHEKDLESFTANDPKGKQLLTYLTEFSQHLVSSQDATVGELSSLRENIEHIKDIVAMQQTYAKLASTKELVNITQLVEDSLRMNVGALTRHNVEVHRKYAEVPSVYVYKHKVLQILINLVRNAKYACDESENPTKELTLCVGNGDGRIRISVVDTGVGISQENLSKIFTHGFTTRESGHGFGLHGALMAAKEMSGSLTAFSEGVNKGATFTLELPFQPIESTES